MIGPEGGEVLDVAALLGSVGDDQELVEEMAGTFLEEIPRWMAELRAAVSGGDAVVVRRVAHGLNGAARYLRAGAVQQAADALERLAETGPLAEAPTALDRLEAELGRLAARLAEAPWRR